MSEPHNRRLTTQGETETNEGGTYRLQTSGSDDPTPARTHVVRTPQAEGGLAERSAESAGIPPAVLRKPKRKCRRGARRGGSGPSVVSALWYPLLGAGPLLLAVYAFLLWSLTTVPIPLVHMVASLLVAAGAGLMLLETASFTLEGIPSRLRFPDLGWESLNVGMYALVVVVISRLPHAIGRWGMDAAGLHSPVIELLWIAVGMYYLPMALITLAEQESERGLNPVLVLRGIGRMPGLYLGLVTLAVIAFLTPILLMQVFPAPALLRDMLQPLWLLYTAVALIRAVAIVYRRRATYTPSRSAAKP